RHRSKQLPAHCTNGAGYAHTRVDTALQPAQLLFILPVDADVVWAIPRTRLNNEVAADSAHAWVRKVLQQQAERILGPGLPHVGKHEDVVLRGLAASAQRHGLSLIGEELDQPYHLGRDGANNLRSRIRGAVGNDNDLSLKPRCRDESR